MKTAIAAIGLFLSANVSAAVVDAVEYFHSGFGHYFVSAFPAEQAVLDAGTTIKGWARTGTSFKVDDASGAPVCRFFSTSFAPRSSHFYTALSSECAAVKTNANWQFEAVSFYVGTVSASGVCASGAPVFRLYNNGKDGAPNHRYVTDTALRTQMIAQGWIAEGYGVGVAFCTAAAAPPADVAQAKTSQMVGGTWVFTYTYGAPYTDTFKFTKVTTGSGTIPWYVNGTNKYGDNVLGGYVTTLGKLMLVSPLGIFNDVYVYDFTGANSASGCYYFDNTITDPFGHGCTSLNAVRTGATVTVDAAKAFSWEVAAKHSTSLAAELAEGDASDLRSAYRELRGQALR